MEKLFDEFVFPPEPLCKRIAAATRNTQIGFHDVIGLWVLLGGGVAVALGFIAASKLMARSSKKVMRAMTLMREYSERHMRRPPSSSLGCAPSRCDSLGLDDIDEVEKGAGGGKCVFTGGGEGMVMLRNRPAAAAPAVQSAEWRSRPDDVGGAADGAARDQRKSNSRSDVSSTGGVSAGVQEQHDPAAVRRQAPVAEPTDAAELGEKVRSAVQRLDALRGPPK